MTEPLQVGQFAIVDHEPVDRGPNAGIFHGRGPADDRAELYLVAEGTSPAGEAFAGQVVTAVGRAWNSLDLSLTGGLQRVFTDAERQVRDWNRKSIPDHQVALGITCFGRRGNHAVIAQAGPGAAFHWHRGRVDTYIPSDKHAEPIGPGEIEPLLTRIEFDPGDRILMLSTAALRELDDELIEGILSLPGEKILAEVYHRIQHLPHVTVLLVQNPPREEEDPASDDDSFVIGEEDEPPADPEPETPKSEERPKNGTAQEVRDGFQPALFFNDFNDREADDAVLTARRKLIDLQTRKREMVPAPVAPAVAVAEMPEPLRPAAGDTRLAILAAQHRAYASLGAAAFPPLRLGHAHPSIDTGSETARRHRRDSFTRSLVREEPPPPPQVHVADVPLADDMAEDVRARNSVQSPIEETIAVNHEVSLTSGTPLVRVRPAIRGRWKAQGALSRRRTIVIGQQPPTWLVILVGLGILLTLVGFLVVPGMIDDQGEAKYVTLINEAQRHMATAEASPDPAAKRAELQQAQALLLEARDTQNAGPEVQQLLNDVRAALEVMDAVREPASVEVLASLEQFGDQPVAVARLVVVPGRAYVLDSASSQVIDIDLSTGERRIVFREDRDAGRGQPVAVAAGEFNGAQHLFVLDGNRALWAVNAAGEVQQLEFAAPKGLAATDIGVHGRDLYVLDAAAAIIWRFSPTDHGYGAPPAVALETPDLAAARRMLVDDEIVTSDADGTLHLFVNQLSLTLSEAGIDERLVEARQPNRFAESGNIAIVDAPNNRIVVFRPDGAFDHQYRHKSFNGISALAMHDGYGYVFAGGQLLRVDFTSE